MTELLIKEREIVVPGEEIVKGFDFLPGSGTYRDGDMIVAARLGLVTLESRAIKITPLSGKYLPKMGDIMIGRVIDVNINGWRIETNSAYSAMLTVKDATSAFIKRGADLTQFFQIGDYVVTKIINVTSQKLIDLTTKAPGLRRLAGGRIVHVNPFKVPRIIGKQGSMVSIIKEATSTRVVVGQNGVIWVQGEPENEIKAISAIKKIEAESHIPGLTDKIKEFLGVKDMNFPVRREYHDNREHQDSNEGNDQFGGNDNQEGDGDFQNNGEQDQDNNQGGLQ